MAESADGRWLVLVERIGPSEVYVRLTARAIVGRSLQAAVSAQMRRDGKELFYLAVASTIPFASPSWMAG
jgi:hypothetical protein